MSCNGPCNQGRRPCPTPAACEQPLTDTSMEMLGMLAMYVAGIVTGVIAILIIV
jgi:hypothetical protein